jgi:hypothetical protein
MSSINVIMALELVVAQKLKQNLTITSPPGEFPVTYERNDLTNAQRRKLRTVFSSKFKRVTAAGTTYVVLDFYFPDIPVSEGDNKLKWLETLKQILPGKEFVLGAWDITGAQYGTTIVPAPIGGSETVTGTPVYPIHARILDIMQDDVTYDGSGNETSRQPAVAAKQTHKLAGWADRRWS